MRRLAGLLLLLALPALALASDPLPGSVLKALGAPNRKAEVAILEEAVGTTTDPALLPWVLLYAGEARRLNGEPGLARTHFERVAGEFPAHRAKNPAILGMAVVDAAAGGSGNTRATLELIGDDNVPDTLNADRYLLLAQARAREGAPAADLAKLTEKAARFAASDKEVSKRVGRAVVELASGVGPATPAPPAGPPDQAAIEAVRAALDGGRFEEAAQLAAAFAERHPDSPFVREASYALRRAQKGTKIVRNRVVVLLPLTGEFAQPAANLKAAIELANSRARAPAELRFLDTGGKPETCVSALEKAVIDDGAAIAVGPLRKEEAQVCAPAAQALRTPMLTLTASAESLAAGDRVFHTFPSTESQVEALLDEAHGKRGLPRYAVLHPTTAYGENAARAFADSLARRGATLAHSVSYDPKTTDFRPVVAKIAPKSGAAVDFDALFIPDGYQRVALIASALAYQEVPVGRFRPRSGVPPVTLLGLNAWNNEELAARGGQYVLDSIFVDAFDSRAADPLTLSFVEAWTAKSQGAPTVVEAVGYDTMLLVTAALERPGDVATGLREASLAQSLTGIQRFDETRDVVRTWRLLTVTREGIGPLEPPAPAPLPP